MNEHNQEYQDMANSIIHEHSAKIQDLQAKLATAERRLEAAGPIVTYAQWAAKIHGHSIVFDCQEWLAAQEPAARHPAEEDLEHIRRVLNNDRLDDGVKIGMVYGILNNHRLAAQSPAVDITPDDDFDLMNSPWPFEESET